MVQMSLLKAKGLVIRSGQASPVTGYFVYNGNPEYGQIPCYPEQKERAIVLEKGQIAPRISSCQNHEALWRFVVEKKSTGPAHTH